MTPSLFPADDRLGLLTDLYELTMAAGYFVQGLADQTATFELWVRRLPYQRNFLVMAGLDQVVSYLQHLSFSRDQVEYLRRHPAFAHVPAQWFDGMGGFHFTGDLWAVPEGTIVFAGEPLLRVTAPLAEAQIIETYLLTSMTIQTMVATKAARVVLAAEGRAIFDFGSRRAHGPQAGLLAARAAYLAGCAGTSNAEAGRLLGIPTMGTQAHAWIMAYDDETEAFRQFGEVFPQACTLLVDTYETLQGVRHAIASGAPLQAIRLDSGDLAALSMEARRILDEAGRQNVKIVASGDLNEYKVQEMLARRAAIDVFGVGTELVTSKDDPTLSVVYKLVEQATPSGTVGRLKLATDKKSFPYAKQVFRRCGQDGTYAEDLVARESETHPGEPLLTRVLHQGRLVDPLPTLEDARQRCSHQLKRLPERLRQLTTAEPYAVRISPALESAASAISKR